MTTNKNLFLVSIALLCVVSLFGQVQDCSTAQVLCNKDPLLIPTISGPGFPDNVQANSCFLDDEHQSHWFTFYATKSGSFEFSVHAIGYQADYDFSLWEGDCPGFPGSVNVACNWNGGIVFPPYVATGIASDPTASFGEPNNLEFVSTINITAGKRYYLIVDNITANDIGFMITFGGTASIGSPVLNYSAGIFCNQSTVDLKSVQVTGLDSVPGNVNYYKLYLDAKNGTNELTNTIVGSSGNYYVKKTTPIGCDAIQTIKVTIENPDVKIEDVNTCGISPFDLNNIKVTEKTGLDLSKFTFTFFNNQTDLLNGTNPITSKSVSTSGTYWARAESLNGCIDIVPFNVNLTTPSATLGGQDIICIGESIPLPIVYNGTWPIDITVQAINVGTVQDNLIVGEPLIVHPQQTTTYQILGVKDSLGCVANVSGTYTIIVNQIPLIDNVSIDCSTDPGNPIIIVQCSQGDIPSYNMAGVNGSFNGTTFTSVPLTAGNKYMITLTDKIGCGSSTWSDTLECKCDPAFKVDLNGVNPKCFGITDGQISSIVTGGNSPFKYKWNNGGLTDKINNLGSGTYTLTVSDGLNCIAKDSFVLIAPAQLTQQSSSEDVKCKGKNDGVIYLSNITGGVGPYTITINNQVYNSFPQTITTLFPGSYFVKVEDSNGCTSQQSFLIADAKSFDIDLGSDRTIIDGKEVDIIPTGDIQDVISLNWSSDLTIPCTDCSELIFKPEQSGFVAIMATNDLSCRAFDTLYIKVLPEPPKDTENVFIPNVFSPNGDGINDFFRPFFSEFQIQGGDLKVYNRWGGLVYDEQFTDEPKGWNGKFHNSYVNSGIYIYVLVLKVNELTKVYKGDITVYR